MLPVLSGVGVAHLLLLLCMYYFSYFMFFDVYVFFIWSLSLDYSLLIQLESWFSLLLCVSSASLVDAFTCITLVLMYLDQNLAVVIRSRIGALLTMFLMFLLYGYSISITVNVVLSSRVKNCLLFFILPDHVHLILLVTRMSRFYRFISAIS